MEKFYKNFQILVLGELIVRSKYFFRLETSLRAEVLELSHVKLITENYNVL